MLIACPDCHRQYDVTSLAIGSKVRCRCGRLSEVPEQKPRKIRMLHCSNCGGKISEQAVACEYCEHEIDRSEEGRGHPCPVCFTPLSKDGPFCSSCGTEIDPEDVLHAVTDHSCPRCRSDLVICEGEEESFHECTECGGIWLSKGVFERFKEDRSSEVRPNPDFRPPISERLNPAETRRKARERRMRCPVCERVMLRQEFAAISGVVIDVCGEHGIWFDVDELEDIARFIEAGGLHFAVSARVTRQAASRRRRLRNRRPSELGRREQVGQEDLLDILWMLLCGISSWD